MAAVALAKFADVRAFVRINDTEIDSFPAPLIKNVHPQNTTQKKLMHQRLKKYSLK